MTILSSTNALLGMPFPQHQSGKTSVTSFLYPGAVQPRKRFPDNGPVKVTMALLGMAFPQHQSGKTSVTSYLYPGAVQPQIQPVFFLGGGFDVIIQQTEVISF